MLKNPFLANVNSRVTDQLLWPGSTCFGLGHSITTRKTITWLYIRQGPVFYGSRN